jgi:hypothetical protein
MTLHDYLVKNLDHTAMISLAVDDSEPFQYNYWNWFHQIGQLHLLKDDYTIGHILHCGLITENDDGGVTHTSKYHPKNCQLNFYFGGAKL